MTIDTSTAECISLPVEEYIRGRQTSGYRFGNATFRSETPFPESEQASRTVPGISFADTGFEVIDGKGIFIAWFACPIDACDCLKAAGEGKLVRCSDRALFRVRRLRRLGR